MKKRAMRRFGVMLFALMCAFVCFPATKVLAGDHDLTDAERASAETIKYGADYTETTSDLSQPVTHKFVVDRNGVFGMKVTKPDEGNKVFSHHFFLLFDANGKEMLHLAHNNTDEQVVEFHVGLTPGVYYIKTKSINTQMAFTYQCSFEATEYAEREMNETKETATVIEADTEYTGYFGGPTYCTDDMKDLYKVNLIKGVTYRFVHEGTNEIHAVLKKDAALDFWGNLASQEKDFVAPYTGEYYVLFYNCNKNQYKYTFMIKTINAAPKESKLTSLKASKKSFTAKWKAVNCDGYELQYGLKSSFKGAKTKTLAAGKKSLKVKSLKSGKKYYVRIRTYRTVGGKKYYSKWSSKKSVKVK